MHPDSTPLEDPFIRMIRNQVDAKRLADFMASDQWSLGQLIDALEAIENKGKSVMYDFPDAVPTTIDSWRGIYAELALGYAFEAKCPTVQTLLNHLHTADGEAFEGYKGGMYTMDRSTPVWVDNYGEYHRTAIVGVHDDFFVVLQTAYMPD